MNGYIVHSAKGTSWKKKDHKYIRKEGNKYIYKVKNKLNDIKDAAADKKKEADSVMEVVSSEIKDTINYAYDDYQAYKKKKAEQKKREEMEATIAAGKSYVNELLGKSSEEEKKGITMIRRKGPTLKEALSNIIDDMKRK